MSMASLTTRAHAFGGVIFQDRRQHRRLLAGIDGGRGQSARGIEHIGVGRDARQRLFDAFELADGKAELAADTGIGARVARRRTWRRPCESAGSEMARPAARQSISMRQPCPACALPPMMVSSGTNTSLPVRRAVLERLPGRIMAAADLDAGRVGGNQRQRNADIFLAAQQMIGIVQTECEAQQRRHGRQRDVALVPGELHAERALAFEFAAGRPRPCRECDAASEPASGPVNAKQGISSPVARRGR